MFTTQYVGIYEDYYFYDPCLYNIIEDENNIIPDDINQQYKLLLTSFTNHKDYYLKLFELTNDNKLKWSGKQEDTISFSTISDLLNKIKINTLSRYTNPDTIEIKQSCGKNNIKPIGIFINEEHYQCIFTYNNKIYKYFDTLYSFHDSEGNHLDISNDKISGWALDISNQDILSKLKKILTQESESITQLYYLFLSFLENYSSN